ncbi:MAG: C39 family peptidase [Chloroflexi bacterium]|nr:C39 family peptidase [Chloroflexota bacterium]
MDDNIPAALPPIDGSGDGDGSGVPWWRWPLVTVLAAVPVVLAAAGVRLGCESATLNVAVCGERYATEAPAPAEVAVDVKEATIALVDPNAAPGAAPVVVAREPSRDFAGQFAKFVVVAPDGHQAIYVTAPDLSMDSARLWLVDSGQPKRLLKQFGDEFWTAKPLWCQARPGDPGVIAYVTRGQVGADLTGLELWTIRADGAGDRKVLSGAPANGFRPELFYGQQRTPMRFLAGCTRVEYRDSSGETRMVDLATGQVVEPMTVPGVPVAATPLASATDLPRPGQPAVPPAPGKPAAPVPGQSTGPACLLQPLAQTDPRWARNVMRPAGTTIGSEGCALTSTAMVFNYFGASTDPAALNACAANQANGLQWDPVRARCSGDRVQTTTWRDNATLRDLEAALAGGRPVIAGFDRPSNSHFVVITSGFGDQLENYHVVDSWDGSTFQTLADFVGPKKGYHLRWLVIFNGPMPDCQPVVASASGAGLGPTSSSSPAVPVTFASPNNGGVYNKPVEVRYHAPPGAAITTSYADGAVVDAEGAYTVTVRADGIPYRVSFIIDKTPPVVTGAWKPFGQAGGELAIEATDNLTYVTEAAYQIDDGPWQPFGPVSDEQASVAFRPAMIASLPTGARLLRYRAKDSAGNQSDVAAIDLQTGAATSPLPSPTTPPAAAAAVTPTPPPTSSPGPTTTPTAPLPPTATMTPTKKPDNDRDGDQGDDSKKTPAAPGPAVAVARSPTVPPTVTPAPTPTVTATPTATATATMPPTYTPVPPSPTAEAPATAAAPDTPEAPAPAKTPDAPEAPAPTKGADKPDSPKKDPPKKDDGKKDDPDKPRK